MTKHNAGVAAPTGSEGRCDRRFILVGLGAGLAPLVAIKAGQDEAVLGGLGSVRATFTGELG
jgi:hypothetical protein